MELINKKEITINYEGEDLKFNISKFPATVGREIIYKYPISNLPGIGDAQVSQETMLQLMSYVERVYDDRVQPLTNKALVDNHIPSWEVLLEIELQMLGYNCTFFKNGKAIDFINKLQEVIEPKFKEVMSLLKDVLNSKLQPVEIQN